MDVGARKTAARFLALLAPAGFERLQEEVGELAGDSSSSPGGPPDVEKVMATAPKHGLEIPPPVQ